MEPKPDPFEQYAAQRLSQDRDEITRVWVETLSSQLRVDPERVLPHQGLLDDIPVLLGKAAEFLLAPEPQKLTGELLVVEEMRSIAHLRASQGWEMAEVVREFDELAQILDGVALRWIDDYPGTPDPKSVGRVFGRLNRVPLLMGQILVGVLEAERNHLLRELAAAEEEERARLSLELHDQLGQLVTALQLGLRTLESGIGAGDTSARIRELERLADRIARETQQLALDLRPPALESLGLPQALENLAGEWSARTGIDADFHAVRPAGTRLLPEVENALYRVAQEALNNVLKHAGAAHVSILLEYRKGFHRLIVEDDGRGFDVEATLASAEKSKRLGVRGMRERVARLGGSLEIESSPGGTTVFVRIPGTPQSSRTPALRAGG
jgi:signal transduction histidine kinase